jgi:hypothetical protein
VATLHEAGVQSIHLALNGAVSSREGNLIANTTTVTFRDGVSREAADVAFASSGASDSTRILGVDVISHAFAGIEMVEVGGSAGGVTLEAGSLRADTTQLVVSTGDEGGEVGVRGDIATTFIGGAGDDVFTGGDAGSTYMGGGGRNLFHGGSGNDTFFVAGSEDGYDVVFDDGGRDTFLLSGDLTAGLFGDDLIIQSRDGGYTLRVVDWRLSGGGDTLILNGETLDPNVIGAFAGDPAALPPQNGDWLLAA